MLVIYLQGFRVEVPIHHRKAPQQKSVYPIKLFYTSNMPIILQSALVSNLYFLSQLLWRRFGEGAAAIVIGLLGKWRMSQSGQLVPEGGLIYYLSPPKSLVRHP